ncbi:MAG: hypothetical protein M0R33_03055 [Methylomonas sp.]|jgi:hypothetical protein|uniref:hypothetical protein n=1 Tax=Methylomonas sp. TaxID=418 RepID=UPI0025E71ADD|nr:hypothetical protein [Methylomonas sp.]MCK9605411.1 hypothetical protein [Methylomonas sp.]
MIVNRLADYLDHIQQAAVDACGYFKIKFEMVWETVGSALPELLDKLSSLRDGGDSI